MSEHEPLSRSEQLVLGGVLRFATRFDGLEARARATAFAETAEALGMRANEIRRVPSERAGYREAALVLQAATSELDGLLARVAVEIPTDAALRARIVAVDRMAARVAIVRAAEALVEHGGITRAEQLFIDWLRDVWRVVPPTPA